MERLAEDADRMNPDDPRAVRELLGGITSGMDENINADDLEQIMDKATDTNGSDAPDPMKE